MKTKTTQDREPWIRGLRPAVVVVDVRAQYREFLLSETWQTIRRLKLEQQPYCALCPSVKGLQVHHRQYPEAMGTERLSDLVVLCEDCHRLHHRKLDSVTANFFKNQLSLDLSVAANE